MVFPLNELRESRPAHGFSVQPFRCKKEDSKVRCGRRRDVLVA